MVTVLGEDLEVGLNLSVYWRDQSRYHRVGKCLRNSDAESQQRPKRVGA